MNNVFKEIYSKLKFWLIFQIVLNIYIGVSPVLIMLLTKNIVNILQSNIDSKNIVHADIIKNVTLFLLLILSDYILSTYSNYFKSKAEIKIDYLMENMLIDKASGVPYSYFENPNFQNHLGRVSNNLGAIFMEPINSCMSVIQNMITFISLFIYIFSYTKLSALTLLMFIPIILVNIKLGKIKYQNNVENTPKAREMVYLNHLLKDRNSAFEIRVFNLKNFLKTKWSEDYWFINNKINYLNKVVTNKNIFLSLAMVLCISLIIIEVSYSIVLGLISLGVFVLILQSVNTIQTTVLSLSINIASMFSEFLYLEDFASFINYEDESIHKKELKKTISYKNSSSVLKVNDLSFNYPHSEQIVLKNISFLIERGDKVAIVGQNGCGKTTLVKCLLNLLESVSGEIELFNSPIEQYSKDELTSIFTVIPQNYIKYNLSIKENIILNSKYEKDKFFNILKFVGLNILVENLPAKENTILGKVYENGEDLSGGQWQAIAIARAMYKQGEILIMDEPTSSLDFKSEEKFYSELKRIANDKTILFISHRTAFTKSADKIIVMDNGKIFETGTHTELISKKGLYYDMYITQLKMIS
ncbi:ABC transporter ATP-binding protein [Enterococcus sp. AZ126]|uniref:ABC transporter ATP-binding protein n=1 Tax=Enterococcus sp. AZ126 TaxID=2774635 RepID=UPI003F1EA1EC